jgi:hypothetical protein
MAADRGALFHADAPVALEDVKDVAAFAEWRARIALGQNGHLTDAQREDASEEALVLIFALHKGERICAGRRGCGQPESFCRCEESQVREGPRWDPERCARFSAFLLTYLDRALIDWWRRELRQSGRGSWNGSTASYRYHGMVSLDDQRPMTTYESGVIGGEDHERVDRALTSHDAHT